MLIKGENLNPKQKAEVLNAFIYRWTKDNNRREEVYHNIGKPSLPLLQSDDEWLAERSFHFVKDGSRLSGNWKHAELAYLADCGGCGQ